MSLSPQQKHEIIQYLSNNEFISATLVQINKDLQGLYPHPLEIGPGTTASILDSFVNTIRPVLQALVNHQPEQLSQFIYRVDLGERSYTESLAKDPSLDDLAQRVVEREAQKVYLRRKYS